MLLTGDDDDFRPDGGFTSIPPDNPRFWPEVILCTGHCNYELRFKPNQFSPNNFPKCSVGLHRIGKATRIA